MQNSIGVYSHSLFVRSINKSLFFVFLLLTLTCCHRISDLENRISQVENELLTQSKLIEIIKTGVSIINIEKGDNSYRIVFSNGDYLELHDGFTPIIQIGENGNWIINGFDTGVSCEGKEPDAIFIGENGNWFIGGIDTGIRATPIDGKDAPYIVSIIEASDYWLFYFSDGKQITANKLVPGAEALFKESLQYGNSMVTFGGSVCEMADICRTYWMQKLNLKIKNYAISGAGFATPTKTIMEQVNEACEEGIFDIYLFWCSTNDLPYKVGNINDYYEWSPSIIESSATQSGGINWCIKKIYSFNPKAKIIFFTSLRQFGGRGYSTFATDNNTWLFQLVDAQRKCCELYGVPYLDQFYTCPFNIYNYTTYYIDATHPNEIGYQLIMRKQALFIANAY